MATRIVIDPRQFAFAQAQLDAVAKLCERPAPLLKVWGIELLKDVHRTFRIGGNPTWAPLKPSTVAAKRKPGKAETRSAPFGFGEKPLASLERTFDVQTDDNAVVLTSTSPVFHFHELGNGPLNEPGGVKP